MKLGILLLEWPLQACLRDFANLCTEQGHEVHFLHDPASDAGYIDMRTLQVAARHRLTGVGMAIVRRLLPSIGRVLRWQPHWWALLARRVENVLRRERYDCLVAVEKLSLAAAARACETSGTPLIYYSLELYVEDHPQYRSFRLLREAELGALGRARGLIIQDPMRERAFRRFADVSGLPALLLPIGRRGAATAPSPASCPDAPVPPTTLLYVGIVTRTRFCEDLVRVAPALPADWRLVLHGPAGEFSPGPLPANVVVSHRMLDEGALQTLIASAEVGIALYDNGWANDRLTAFSSQKVADYLRHGVPIVAFRNESYAALMARHRCGVMIDKVADLPQAVQAILADRAAYRAAALRAFSESFDLERTAPPVIARIVREFAR